MNLLIDLFDHSGHAAEPYRKNGWHVIQVDIKNGIDILTWDYKNEIFDFMADIKYIYPDRKIFIGLFAAIPCTDYALSGAAHFKLKDADGRTDMSQELVHKVKEIKDWVEVKFGKMMFWRVENPMSRIHKLNPWLGEITHKFNPCDYAGYVENNYTSINPLKYFSQFPMSSLNKDQVKKIMDLNAYNKMTWLWGDFNIPDKKRIEPVYKEFPGHILYGGKSERTKELRSVDPKGFCQAFYEANH